MSYIYSMVEANPGLYVDEIQQKLFEARDVNVSIATISHAIKRLAVSNKKVAKEALERDEFVQVTWLADIAQKNKKRHVVKAQRSSDGGGKASV